MSCSGLFVREWAVRVSCVAQQSHWFLDHTGMNQSLAYHSVVLRSFQSWAPMGCRPVRQSDESPDCRNFVVFAPALPCGSPVVASVQCLLTWCIQDGAEEWQCMKKCGQHEAKLNIDIRIMNFCPLLLVSFVSGGLKMCPYISKTLFIHKAHVTRACSMVIHMISCTALTYMDSCRIVIMHGQMGCFTDWTVPCAALIAARVVPGD